MSVDTIAGCGGVIFSVLISAAIIASREPKIFQSGLGKSVTALLFIGTAGLLAFLILATLCWPELGKVGRATIITFDVIGFSAVVALFFYYFSFYRKNVWKISNIYPHLPPSQPLIQPVIQKPPKEDQELL